MSQPPPPLFVAPGGQPPGTQPPGTEPQGKPPRFSAVVILAIVLTSVGTLMSLFAVVSALLSEQIMSFTTPPATPGAPEMTRAIEEMQAKMRELSMPWLTGSLAGVNLAVCIWGLWAALRMQRRKGRRGFAFAMTALGIIEMLSLAGGLFIQVRTLSVIQELIDRMRLGATPGAPANLEPIMRATMLMSVIVGIAFALGWGALKIGFCFYARHYANKPEVRAWVTG